VQSVRSAAVIDVATAVEKLRVDDAVLTHGDMLLADIESVLESITGLQAVLLRRLRTARELDAVKELCGRSTKNWLHEEQLLPQAEAGRLTRLMTHLPNFPLTQAAFDEQRINIAHVAAILTALYTLPVLLRDTVEPHLVDRATHYPPEEIAGFLDELLDGLGIDKASDVRRDKRHNERGVDLAPTLDGTRSIAGTLSPEVGEKLEAALAHAGHKAGPDDMRSQRQRRHDALGALADAYLSQHEPSFTGAPRTVIVTMTLDTLETRLREQWIEMPSGAQLSAETARRLACDAELIPIVLGRNSEVLDIGQADHEFTTAQRRAAYQRDGGTCVFPNCGNPVEQLHHIVYRSRGGATSLDNAAWLCAFHHWLTHEGGWTLQRAANGGYIWTNPLGQQFERSLDRHT